MAKTGVTTVGFSCSGDGINNDSYSYSNSNAAAPGGGPYAYTLANGDNTLTAPSGAQYLFIIPDSTSTVTKKLKGNVADVGWGISSTKTTVVALGSGTYIINASAGETIQIAWQ